MSSTDVMMRGNFSPARNVRSMTAPVSNGLELRAHERAALARLDVLELDDPEDGALHVDVHAVLELVRVDVSAMCLSPTSISDLGNA